jgi:hypothetical protein
MFNIRLNKELMNSESNRSLDLKSQREAWQHSFMTTDFWVTWQNLSIENEINPD